MPRSNAQPITNKKPVHHETLSWGTQFLMYGFAIAADLIGLAITFIGIIFMAMGPWALGGGAVAGAVAGAAQGCTIKAPTGIWDVIKRGGSVGMMGECVQDAAGNIAGGAAAGAAIPFFLGYGSFVINWIFTAAIAFFFWLWFKIKTGHGVRRKSVSKRPLYMALNIAIESLLGFVPGWSLFAYFSIRETQKQDEKANKETAVEQPHRTHRMQHTRYARYQPSPRAV